MSSERRPPRLTGGMGGTGTTGGMDAGARRTRVAVAVAFAAQGLGFAVVTTHLPAFQSHYGIDDTAVTIVLFAVAVLAGVGTWQAERISTRRGSAVALRLSLLVITAGLAIIALAPGTLVLYAGFAVYGVGVGGLDASENMQAVALEHRYGRSILTSFHASWSAAGITGALYTFGTERLDLPLSGVLLVVAAAILACAAYMGGRLASTQGVAVAAPSPDAVVPQSNSRPDAQPDAKPGVALPWRPVLLLGLAMVCFYVADSGTSSWSSIYLHDVLHTTTSVAALAYAGYAGSSLVSRIIGDHAVRRFSAPAVVRAAGVIGAGGLLVVVLAQQAWVAILGFVILGLGIAVIAPLSFAAAGELAPGNADAVVAKVNVFNYVGFVVGGVVVGIFGSAGVLRWGFVVPLVLTLVIVLLAPAFHPRPVAVAPPPVPVAPGSDPGDGS